MSPSGPMSPSRNTTLPMSPSGPASIMRPSQPGETSQGNPTPSTPGNQNQPEQTTSTPNNPNQPSFRVSESFSGYRSRHHSSGDLSGEENTTARGSQQPGGPAWTFWQHFDRSTGRPRRSSARSAQSSREASPRNNPTSSPPIRSRSRPRSG